MSLQRNRIYLTKDVKLDGETYGVFFHPKNTTVYSASRSFRFVAVFDSPPSESLENIFSWKTMKLIGSNPNTSDVKIYIKSADSVAGLSSKPWIGPYLNGFYEEDISSVSGKFIVVRILLESCSDELDSVAVPIVDKLEVTAFTYGTEQKLFTKTFDLGFVPKHIVLTYNGEGDEKALLQFALAGKDSIDNSDYQLISANKIVKLDKLSDIASKMKVMVRAIGSNEESVDIDSFALIVGGSGRSQLNQS